MNRCPLASRLRPGAGVRVRDLFVRDALAAGRREGGSFVLGGGARGAPVGRSAAAGAASTAGGRPDRPVKTKGRREGVNGAGAAA